VAVFPASGASLRAVKRLDSAAIVSDLHPSGENMAEERIVENKVAVTTPVETVHGDGKSQPVAAPSAKKNGSRRRIVLGVLAIVALALILIYGVPAISAILNSVSTDDAYINGHVTFVAARVPGQVTKVWVDDNDRVSKGSILVQLDKEPYDIQVALKKAAFETAEAQLLATEDSVRGQVAQVRSNRFKLQHAIESVDNQIALLRANVAALETKKANLTRAKADYDRATELQKTSGAIAPQEVDQRREAFSVAQAQVVQAQEAVYQIRVGLGLSAKPEKGEDLTQVPPELDQNYSTVRQALADLMASVAPLGVFPPSYNASPKETIADFYRRDPNGDLDRIYARLIKASPDIKLAKAKLDQAKSDLDQANLNLRYCDVVAEIDGVITRRNVNPGNNVQAGEGLMAIRSLTEIWVDANFKETQLDNLRIGQHADLEVDMFGRRKTLHGVITGFTMGTGSTLALLPAENATGNFIKVVQRLPVRIDFTDYDPDTDPLFVGLSVVPSVWYKEKLADVPNSGKMLRPLMSDLPVGKLPRTLPVPAAGNPPSISSQPAATGSNESQIPKVSPAENGARPGVKPGTVP
jgi:membrane fusion protein, multidrug efflux system